VVELASELQPMVAQKDEGLAAKDEELALLRGRLASFEREAEVEPPHA
jgi:hypothetical protein